MAAVECYDLLLLMLLHLISNAAAQDEIETCYSPGSIVGAIVGTLFVTIALFASCILLYKIYWRSRKGKHLVLVTDAENPGDQFAFDNPCFREATPIKHNLSDEKNISKLEKNRWLGWTPLHTFGGQKTEKVTSLDDSYINDSHLKVVNLKGHDFTGLGFNICGNMRDGIFVKDVLHRGPAFESGCINSGDRIDSVCISFRNMVFEDALTILSYASPYEVQVQVENDSHSRPSTLIRSKRESNAVHSAERILHPKYNRSQSISHLTEIGKTNNKRINQQLGFTSEKNRINQSLNKSQEYYGSPNDYPTLKLSSSLNEPKKEHQKLEKNALAKLSPMNIKKSPLFGGGKKTEEHSEGSEQGQNDSQNKFQKFGIKVLPISINPKMGIQSVTGAKKSKEQTKKDAQNQLDNEKNLVKEAEKQEQSIDTVDDHVKKGDETDGSKDNVKTILTKGFQNLKEKINQNTLGKKKNKEPEKNGEADKKEEEKEPKGEECPVPKARSSVPCGIKAYEQSQQNQTCINIPEEVTRAGDVARNNRKSTSENMLAASRKSMVTVEDETKKSERSSSESSSDGGSPRVSDNVKRPKRSKGKAPAPPQTPRKASTPTNEEINEIKKESDVEKSNIFEPSDVKMEESQEGNDTKSLVESYDSDSDTETRNIYPKDNGTKIELNATQVTIHHSPTSENGNDEEIETRKAASLGDLSKLESDHTLTVVLERAVSLDLADGTSQCGKKRKAPLPPPEEFPAVFDDVCYRKEPRLENSLGMNTFQRRLKKSSDFGTLEDALQDGPKSLEIEVNKHNTPLDLLETYNSNIQEFSSWLADCRKPKKGDEDLNKKNSTSLVNVNVPDDDVVNSQVQSVSVNGKNLDFDDSNVITENINFPGNSKTVLVISQPNSITEPIESEPLTDESYKCVISECETTLEPFVTANETTLQDGEDEETDDGTPPKLPTSPMPTLSTLSSPLSSSLTYITEIKVSTSEQDIPNDTIEPEADSVSRDDDEIVSSTPIAPNKRTDIVKMLSERILSENKIKPKGIDRSLSSNEAVTVSYENADGTARRASDVGFEASKIPIRTMKSETGQKVLATIQSLAAKESVSKTPEVEYAKRVASLFSSASPIPKTGRKSDSNENSHPNISGFYLKTNPATKTNGNKKTPPVVPPRKTDTSLSSGKSSVTVELTGNKNHGVSHTLISENQTDPNVVTFSSFMPRKDEETETSPRIASWNDNMTKEHGGINGGHMHVQMQTGVVNLPVKTSATKIVFENKDLDNEEF